MLASTYALLSYLEIKYHRENFHLIRLLIFQPISHFHPKSSAMYLQIKLGKEISFVIQKVGVINLRTIHTAKYQLEKHLEIFVSGKNIF